MGLANVEVNDLLKPLLNSWVHLRHNRLDWFCQCKKGAVKPLRLVGHLGDCLEETPVGEYPNDTLTVKDQTPVNGAVGE